MINTNLATQARRAAQPILLNRLTTYGIAACALLVLALIAPVFARGWIMAIGTIALTITGIEVIRTIDQRDEQQTT